MDSSDGEDFIPGRTPKPTTAKKYAERHGDSRVSLLDVMTKVKPHSPTTQALEERAARDLGTKKGMYSNMLLSHEAKSLMVFRSRCRDENVY